MFKGVKSKLGSLYSNAREKASHSFSGGTPLQRLVRDNKGNSELVAVIVLIAIVLVIGVAVFLPAMKDYFETTVAPSMKTATQNIFNFGS